MSRNSFFRLHLHYPRKEHIDNMIQLINVTSSYCQTAKITFDLLSPVVIDKACDEWNFVINSDRSFKEELARE